MKKDLEIMKKIIEKQIRHRYKIPLASKVGHVFENIVLFFILCLAIIFRPLNLLIIGMIIIICLLI